MAPLLRPWRLIALSACGALVACGTGADPEPPVGPLPSDPVVYDASAETAHDVGIAKWGFSTDDADGATLFRGYGGRNELLVEIRQTFTQGDLFTKSFAMKMSGPVASGSEQIDYVAQWAADGQSMEYVTSVRENTFAQGSLAARVLARLAPDAAAMAAREPTSGGAPTLTKSIQPQGLVAVGPEPLLQCCSQLTRESVAMSAIPGSECPLVTPSNQSLATGGLGTRALVLGNGGQAVVQSPWSGPYNIVDHHCHNAAAQNSSQSDGYIACVASSSTTQTMGHTINWAPDPSKAGTAGAFCAYEPQSNGGTLLTDSVCCWQGNAGSDGAPLFDAAGAQGCVSKLCLGQADFPGWFRSWFVTPPKAFPAGSTPPTPNDCPGTTATSAACNTCCTTQADRVSSLFGSSSGDYRAQIQGYRGRCAVACLDREVQRQAKAAADRCAASALQALRSRMTAQTSCSSPR